MHAILNIEWYISNDIQYTKEKLNTHLRAVKMYNCNNRWYG